MPAPSQESVAEKAALAEGGRFTALLYDKVLALGERAGMADRRRALIAQATGDVLEIGAGTGLNAVDYREDLSRLVLTEPEKFMAQRLKKRVEQLGVEAEVAVAPAEALPFDDASFDCVVATLVLCTVQDPQAAIDEIVRVLRPGGRFLFVEHIRADDPGLARWQDRLHKPWFKFAAGCNCNRSTLDLLAQSGLETGAVEHAEWRRMPALVRPLAIGAAVKP